MGFDISVYVAAYLSHKQNKVTLEIQDKEPYTPTSNLSFFTVLLPTVLWQLAHAFPASELTWLYHVKNKDSFYIVSAWVRQNNFSAISRKLGSGIWKRASEFSSYKIELRNRVTQNDVTLRVTNSKTFIEILLSSTNSIS